MKVMNGSWSLSGCCGREARGARLSRVAAGFAAVSPFGAGAAGSGRALVCRGLGSRAGAFVALALSDGALDPRERRLAGGGELGTGIGADAALLAAAGRPPPRALRVAIRLLGPRTGVRSTKIQPTPGTGRPPISRPASKSHL